MKSKYDKPRMKVVPLQGHHNLLAGVSVNMSGYTRGGNGINGSDGWED